MSWKDDVRERFSTGGQALRWNDLYRGEPATPEECFFRQRCERVASWVLERCDEHAPILDVGCGSGPVTAALRRHGRQVVALDYSLDMLRLADERFANEGVRRGGLLQGDSERLPFRPGTFDAVVCLGVISYVKDYGSVLREARRVLKPHGLLVLSTRNELNPRFFDPVEPAKAAVRWLRDAWRGRRTVAIGRFLSPYDVERRLRETGFVVETFTGIGFGPPRFNRRHLLSVASAIRLSDSLGRVFERLDARPAYRLLADVNLWTCRVGNHPEATS